MRNHHITDLKLEFLRLDTPKSLYAIASGIIGACFIGTGVMSAYNIEQATDHLDDIPTEIITNTEEEQAAWLALAGLGAVIELAVIRKGAEDHHPR